MASLYYEFFGTAGSQVDSNLGTGNAGGGLDGGAEDERVAVGDASVDAAGAVAGSVSCDVGERVIVLRAAHAGGSEAVAELYAPDARYGENHLGNGRLHRIEEGLAQTGGDSAADTFHHSTDRIAFGRHLGEEGIEGRIVPFIPCEGQAPDLRQTGINLYRGNDFPGHHTRSNEGKGHPSGEHSASGGKAVRSVFDPAHPVRMAGTGNVGKLLIGGRVRILIAEEELEGGAGGQAVLHAPDDLRDILLRAGGSPLAAGTAAVYVLSEVPGTQRNTLRHAVDLNRHERTVGFPCQGNPEYVSESVAHIVSCY